jgi:hypothetical protein
MNFFRAFTPGGWLLAGLLGAAGCATTPADDAARAAQRKEWDAMSASQKFVDFNLWLLEGVAYGLGQSGASFSP